MPAAHEQGRPDHGWQYGHRPRCVPRFREGADVAVASRGRRAEAESLAREVEACGVGAC